LASLGEFNDNTKSEQGDQETLKPREDEERWETEKELASEKQGIIRDELRRKPHGLAAADKTIINHRNQKTVIANIS